MLDAQGRGRLGVRQGQRLPRGRLPPSLLASRRSRALEHAYAVTTYSAQGATVDRAFVAADPSMDKLELYVAASRSREETFIYATPEIQAHREEIAPESPYLREGIPHIAEAAERDRSQFAAHDEALRSQFAGMPSEEPSGRASRRRGGGSKRCSESLALVSTRRKRGSSVGGSGSVDSRR